jgi:hypothetical protein
MTRHTMYEYSYILVVYQPAFGAKNGYGVKNTLKWCSFWGKFRILGRFFVKIRENMEK